jgi:Uma2 family endonuclease
MSLQTTKLTYDDYVLIPDDGLRHEIIDGEHFVNPAPNRKHQTVSVNLILALGTHVRAHRLGAIYHAPFDVVLSRTDVVQPDIVFVSNAREESLTNANLQGAPNLAIEILSPSTRKLDTVVKLQRYELFGVDEYWIVDPETEDVAVYRRSGDRLERVEAADPITSPLLPGLAVTLRDVFAD